MGKEQTANTKQRQQPTTNNKQQTTNNNRRQHSKQQTDNKQATNNKQQTRNNKPQTTNHKQQTTNHKQQTTNNKQYNKQPTPTNQQQRQQQTRKIRNNKNNKNWEEAFLCSHYSLLTTWLLPTTCYYHLFFKWVCIRSNVFFFCWQLLRYVNKVITKWCSTSSKITTCNPGQETIHKKVPQL